LSNSFSTNADGKSEVSRIPTTEAISASRIEPTMSPVGSQPTPLVAPEVTPQPTLLPTPDPTPDPTLAPTLQPTPQPTAAPLTRAPTPQPTPDPTLSPLTRRPTPAPTPDPTLSPLTSKPTQSSTIKPSSSPSVAPTPAELACDLEFFEMEANYYIGFDGSPELVSDDNLELSFADGELKYGLFCKV
jgi:hypothetical protein